MAELENWHYKRGEAEYGPMSARHLRSLRERGTLGPDTPVREAGAALWIRLADAHLPAEEAVESSVATAKQVDEADPNLPGASVVYAPPRSAHLEISEPGPSLFLWISALLTIVAGTANSFCRFMEGLFTFSNLVSPDDWPSWLMPPVGLLEAAYQACGGYPDASHLIFILMMLTWQAAAFASLRHLYGDGMMKHGPASFFWWITPIANIFMPMFCLRELRHLSRKRRDRVVIGVPFGALLWFFQGSAVLGVVARFMERAAPESHGVLLFYCLVAVSFSSSLVIIVTTNLIQQVRLYRNWHA